MFAKRTAHLKYSTVIEFQKRGAVHYHCVFYNVPYVPNLLHVLRNIWSHGSVDFSKVRRIKSMGSYLTKYMTKSNDDQRLNGKKSHFSSRGLKKPLVFRDEFKIADILWAMPEKLDEFELFLPGLDYKRANVGNHMIRYLADFDTPEPDVQIVVEQEDSSPLSLFDLMRDLPDLP